MQHWILLQTCKPVKQQKIHWHVLQVNFCIWMSVNERKRQSWWWEAEEPAMKNTCIHSSEALRAHLQRNKIWTHKWVLLICILNVSEELLCLFAPVFQWVSQLWQYNVLDSGIFRLKLEIRCLCTGIWKYENVLYVALILMNMHHKSI